MSKQRIEEWIPLACEAIRTCGLSKENKVDPAHRGKIASFGAAVTMGNLLSAVAFFSNKGGADSERQLLMKAIHWILSPADKRASVSETSLLYELIKNGDSDKRKADILDAAVAIKLAMNLFDLGNRGKGSETEAM